MPFDPPAPLVLFASKYGSTREYAEAVARELACPAFDVAGLLPEGWEKGGTGEGPPYLVLGAPIYGPSVLPAMEEFCRAHRQALAGRPLAAFVVCGDTVWIPPKGQGPGEGGSRNLEKLTRLLPREPFASAVFPGRMRMDELDARDRPAILAFYQRLGRPPNGFDRMDPAAAGAFARLLGDAAGRGEKNAG